MIYVCEWIFFNSKGIFIWVYIAFHPSQRALASPDTTDKFLLDALPNLWIPKLSVGSK